MIRMTLAQAAALLGAQGPHPDLTFCGLSIDTRTLATGNLFAALPGQRVDGHDFLDQALEKGAACALVNRPVDSALPQLIVPDVVLAMGQLAKAWRDQFAIPFVAVTGSNGKTTLKNMISTILTA